MNRTYLATIFLLALALLLGGTRAAHAAESYDNCTGFINTVPAVITSQGTWCLKHDLSTAMTSGNAIEIKTNNVTIDCNDFKLDGLAAGSGTFAIGIYGQDRLNATVRHCSIRGFYAGLDIFGSSSGGHAIDDNRFDRNTYQALWLQGDGSVVRRNRVSNTGGSTISANAYGIYTHDSVDVRENTVTNVLATYGGGGYAFGIYVVNNPDGSVSDNRVRMVLNDGATTAYGIYDDSSGHVTLRNNDVVDFYLAVSSVGVGCAGTGAHAKDNEINGFATGLSGCNDDGGNVVAP